MVRSSLILTDTHDRYGDDTTSKEPVVPSQPSAPEPPGSTSAPGYGEEPEFEHDPTSFEVDTAAQETSAIGTNGDHQDHRDHRDSGYGADPGIQMKDDG